MDVIKSPVANRSHARSPWQPAIKPGHCSPHIRLLPTTSSAPLDETEPRGCDNRLQTGHPEDHEFITRHQQNRLIRGFYQKCSSTESRHSSTLKLHVPSKSWFQITRIFRNSAVYERDVSAIQSTSPRSDRIIGRSGFCGRLDTWGLRNQGRSKCLFSKTTVRNLFIQEH